jgi:hypothetical protein
MVAQAAADPAGFIQSSLKEDHLPPARIRLMQQALKLAGYDPGNADGAFGPNTAGAIKRYLSDHPQEIASISRESKERMAKNGYAFGADKPLSRSFAQAQDQALYDPGSTRIKFHRNKDNYGTAPHEDQKSLLHPHVAMIMDIKEKNDPRIASLRYIAGSRLDIDDVREKQKYIQMTFDAAKRHGLDGNMLVNQFWIESKFDPRTTSSAGARGISQMVPRYQQGKYGMDSTKDFSNPEKSIEGGARYMADLTQKYGSQKAALIAFNAGPKGMTYGGVFDLPPSQEEWMSFVGDRRSERGEGRPGAWRNETYNYVRNIDSRYWNGDLLNVARAYEGKTQETAARAAISTPLQNQPVIPGTVLGYAAAPP